MNLEQIKKDLPIQCESNLKALYEMCCEEYRRRLCDQWEMSFDGSFWIADIVGEGLSMGDYWVLDMTEIKYCVENGVTYEAYDEYWEFLMDEAHEGRDHPRINFWSWFKGLRPNMLKE